jgi:crotonobetainyl-CoA:carnitine CoA-transferase CaiB-like acyl-CoA transferase
MFDAFVWWNTLLAGRYDFNGDRLEMNDLEHPTVGYNLYKTKDGRTMAFALMEQKFWKPFCEEMGFGEDMVAALRLHRHEAPEAFRIMETLVASRTMAEWMKWLGDKDMCIAPVKMPTEAIQGIVASGTGLMEYRELPGLGRTLMTKIPHKISTLPVDGNNTSPPPRLEKTVPPSFRSVGYSSDEIRQMASDGAIKGIISDQ